MRDYDKYDEPEHSDTEITLGTRSILGIFFGLVLICGVFFGFGYSVGRGNSTKVAPAAAPASQTVTPSTTSSPSVVKTVVEQPAPSNSNSTAADPYDYSTSSTNPPKPSGAILPPAPAAPTLAAAADTNTPPASSTSSSGPVSAHPAQVSYNPPASSQKAVTPTYPAPLSANPPASIMLQVAAVSRQQDADVLISALKQHGFSASVRTQPADHFLHIQVGPFATRAQAVAMRVQLLNDGYNAILK